MVIMILQEQLIVPHFNTGDKTFFIAAIMAMKHPRTLIFGAAISALGSLTLKSQPTQVSQPTQSIIFYISLLLLYFSTPVSFSSPLSLSLSLFLSLSLSPSLSLPLSLYIFCVSVVMTVLSVLLGFITTIIPRLYTFYASTLLFIIFGTCAEHVCAYCFITNFPVLRVRKKRNYNTSYLGVMDTRKLL